MYVYINSEPNLWTVGFYDPSGEFKTDSDHEDREKAAKRVNYLNGGAAIEDIDWSPLMELSNPNSAFANSINDLCCALNNFQR